MKYRFFAAIAAVTLPLSAHADETATRAYIETGFASMDRDRNGLVTLTEFDLFMRDRLAKQSAEFDEAFAELDKNSDGKISRGEAKAHSELLKHFGAIDGDRNGSLTKDELRQAMLAAAQAQAS